jgi:hypothetical protein
VYPAIVSLWNAATHRWPNIFRKAGAAALVVATTTHSSSARAEPKDARVLFSGHSLLDNPVPDWVDDIAESRGQRLYWEEQIVIGSPIRVRTKGDDSRASDWPGYSMGKNRQGRGLNLIAEIERPTSLDPNGRYERLIIAERNDLLDAMRWERTMYYLQNFHDHLVRALPSARTSLYQVWPAINKNNPQAWIDYVRKELLGWECAASTVNHVLAGSGRSDRIDIIPGAMALATLVERALAGRVPGITGSTQERLNAIFSDNVHLTATGQYLIAAVHYTAIFEQGPPGAFIPPSISVERGRYLQNLAWSIVARYKLNNRPPSECRTRVATELCPDYQRFLGRSDTSICSYWSAATSPLAVVPAF